MNKQQTTEETIRAWNEAHPVGSEVSFDGHASIVAAPAQVCFGEPMAFLRGVSGPVAIAKMSAPEALPTEPEMLALIEHATHSAWVARNKASATGNDDRREEYEGEAENLDLLAKTARQCLALLALTEGSTEAPTLPERSAGIGAGISPAPHLCRWRWFDSEGRIVPGPKAAR